MEVANSLICKNLDDDLYLCLLLTSLYLNHVSLQLSLVNDTGLNPTPSSAYLISKTYFWQWWFWWQASHCTQFQAFIWWWSPLYHYLPRSQLSWCFEDFASDFILKYCCHVPTGGGKSAAPSGHCMLALQWRVGEKRSFWWFTERTDISNAHPF